MVSEMMSQIVHMLNAPTKKYCLSQSALSLDALLWYLADCAYVVRVTASKNKRYHFQVVVVTGPFGFQSAFLRNQS